MRAFVLMAITLLSLTSSGCFAISDLGRFEPDEGCDVDLDLQGFTPHAEDLFELRVVKIVEGSTTPFLSARAILDPMGAVNARIVMLDAAPAGHAALDFYSDENNDDLYTDPPDDHVWRIDDACVSPTRVFVHRFDFVNLTEPIAIGEDFTLSLSGMNADGNALEVRVISMPPAGVDEPPPARTVGLYRKAAVTQSDFDVTIPGIIDLGSSYQVTIWSDKTGDGVYDSPLLGPDEGDESWIIPALGSDLTSASFAHLEDYNEIADVVVELR
ncbi:MAG: hypothetical protein GXP55_24560 [Deltaproteobacteria bacterium]|nr:hypothetical protein [Deltaproteobacteria bacterium]